MKIIFSIHLESENLLPVYAKLQGRGWMFYIRTFSILIGLKDNSLNIVYKNYLKIQYNQYSGNWELFVYNFDGVFVQDKYYGPFSIPIVLHSRYLYTNKF